MWSLENPHAKFERNFQHRIAIRVAESESWSRILRFLEASESESKLRFENFYTDSQP